MPAGTQRELNAMVGLAWPDAGGWEYARNDPLQDSTRTPDFTSNRWYEVSERNMLRTVNGRPRESSYTRTRVIQRQGSRRRQR